MAYGAQKPQSPNSYIILDFETGGLSSNDSAATEIALVAIKGDLSLDEICRYQALIKQYDDVKEYNEKALKLTSISLELLEEEGEQIDLVVDSIIDVFKKANCYAEKSPGLRPILVGQNVMFDINFLHHIFEFRFRNDKKTNSQKILEDLLHGRRDHFGNFQPSYIDIWSIGKMWFGGDRELVNFKLGTLLDQIGIELTDAHRAMNDVVATTDVLRAAIRNLRSGFGSGVIGETSYKNKREGFMFPI